MSGSISLKTPATRTLRLRNSRHLRGRGGRCFRRSAAVHRPPLFHVHRFVLSGSVAAARPYIPEFHKQLDHELPAVGAVAEGGTEGTCDEHEMATELQECHLALRIAALHIELYRLQHAATDAPPELFAGRFASVLHVRTFVLDLVGRIKASLLRERALRDSVEACIGRATYRIAVANAAWAFGMIGRDPDLARFLAVGARAGSERLRASCQMIGLLLGGPNGRWPFGSENTAQVDGRALAEER